MKILQLTIKVSVITLIIYLTSFINIERMVLQNEIDKRNGDVLIYNCVSIDKSNGMIEWLVLHNNRVELKPAPYVDEYHKDAWRIVNFWRSFDKNKDLGD